MNVTEEFNFSFDGPVVSVRVGETEQSRINLNQPEILEFEYMQQMDTVTRLAFPEPHPISALHVGGCGCALAWAWETLRPNSRQLAFEVNAELAEAVRKNIPLPRKPQLRIRVAEGAAALVASQARYQVIVRDAFVDASVPAHLQTSAWVRSVRDHLLPNGLYLANAAHGPRVSARPDVAATVATFDRVAIIGASKVVKSARRGNLVVAAWNDHDLVNIADLDRDLRKLPLPVSLVQGAALSRWLGGAVPVPRTA